MFFTANLLAGTEEANRYLYEIFTTLDRRFEVMHHAANSGEVLQSQLSMVGKSDGQFGLSELRYRTRNLEGLIS